MSTSTTDPILDYSPAAEFDTGRFVAVYLQACAWISIAWMIVGPLCFGASFRLDLSPIVMFWLASGMKAHNSSTRIVFLIFCAFGLALCGVVVAWALVVGTRGITIKLGVNIRSPKLWQLLLVVGCLTTAIAVPAVVLLSDRAREQFARRR